MQPADDFYGTPPSVFYIDYGIGGMRKGEFLLTQIEDTYRLCSGKVEVAIHSPSFTSYHLNSVTSVSHFSFGLSA